MKIPRFLLAKKTNEILKNKGGLGWSGWIFDVTTALIWTCTGLLNIFIINIYIGLINFLCVFCYLMAAIGKFKPWYKEYKNTEAEYIEEELRNLNKKLKEEKLNKMNFWNEKEKNG